MTHQSRLLAASAAFGIASLAAAPAWADGWRFNGAEVGDGFLALVYFEEGQSAPLSLTCAWRRDGEMVPLKMDDVDFEGLSPTPPGQMRLEVSTEIAGGYGEEAPALEIRVGETLFDDLGFQGDVIGYTYAATVPVEGVLLDALKGGEQLAIRSSLAPQWEAPLGADAQAAFTEFQQFCGRQNGSPAEAAPVEVAPADAEPSNAEPSDAEPSDAAPGPAQPSEG